MQLLRASRRARRIGSPAVNGTAKAVVNRICNPASSDSAFSAAVIASTSSAPDNPPGVTPANAVNDAASAAPAARAAQFTAGAGPGVCSAI